MAAKDEVRRSKLEDNNLLSPPPPPCNYQLYPWFSAVEERFSPPCVESSSKLWKNPAWICPLRLRYGGGGVMVGILGMMIGRAVEW
jgi:hypothetical protein